MSLGVELDRCEYGVACMCVFRQCMSVSMCVIQMGLRHGKISHTYFPGEPKQTWPETLKQKDITIAL